MKTTQHLVKLYVSLYLLLIGLTACAQDTPLGEIAQEVQNKPAEYGNTLEASNSANWGGGKWENAKYALSFIAKHDSELDAVWTHWRTTAPGYGGGDLGTWTFELHTDNPDSHVPSDTIISKVVGFKNPPEGYFRIDLPNVKLENGKVYHLVMYNTDPDPRTNWSSPNMIRSRIDDPWAGEGPQTWGENGWKPVVSADAQQLTMYGGHARAAYLLEYTDGTKDGQPYYSASRRLIFGTSNLGELIPWKQPDLMLSEIGFPVFTVGKPADALNFTLEEMEDGKVLLTGKLVEADKTTTSPEWYRVKLATPIVLQQGKNYRFYLSAPGCADEKNCYGIFIPYSSEKVTGWPELTWGGRGGRFTYFKDGKWQLEGSIPYDLSFSLLGTLVK